MPHLTNAPGPSTLTLDTSRHDMVFDPETFNPRRVALAGSAEYISPILIQLARLGIQRFVLYSTDDLGQVIRLARASLERNDGQRLDITSVPLTLLSPAFGPKAEVLFLVHPNRNLIALLLGVLCSPSVSRVIIYPRTRQKKLELVLAETAILANRTLDGSDDEPIVLSSYAGFAQVFAGTIVYAFMAWWGSCLPSGKPERLANHKLCWSSGLEEFVPRRPLTVAELATGIDVLGQGAVGSWVTLGLLAAGFSNVRGYDFDIVEEANVANQAAPRRTVGKPKTLAIREACRDYGLHGYTEVQARADLEHGQFAPIVVLAIDDMAGRGLFLRNAFGKPTRLAIDARISHVSGIATALPLVSADACRDYAEALRSADDRTRVNRQAACRTPSIGPIAVAVAGLVVNQIYWALAEQGLENPSYRYVELKASETSVADDF